MWKRSLLKISHITFDPITSNNQKKLLFKYLVEKCHMLIQKGVYDLLCFRLALMSRVLAL
jgi:hypothetical protein